MIRAALLSAVLLLAACSADTTVYPSLAPRPAEKHGFEEPEAAAPRPVAADPALDARIADLGNRLDGLAKDFAAAASEAERSAAAARGAAAGSEPWLAAQTALAGLDDLHSQVSALNTEAEQAAVDRAATLAPDYPALATITKRIETENAGEGETIARLARSLAPA